jgi:hypothetical protein
MTLGCDTAVDLCRAPGGAMTVFRRAIDKITFGSERPVRRLVAYYVLLAAVFALAVYAFPDVKWLMLGSAVDATTGAGPELLQDGLTTSQAPPLALDVGSLTELALSTTLALVGTLVLMLPVTWVYMFARQVRGHNQAMVQTLIMLPLVVAGIVFIVRNSLALAFSLAGVVAAVRFRTNLRDARDVVFIFLAIAVGFSAGVQTLAVGVLLSVTFNFVLLLTWRYDFGRNVLEPTAAAQWSEPLETLAGGNGNHRIPDRDLVLALTPARADALVRRFERLREVLGPGKKKPRYNAVLSITTDRVSEAQVAVQKVLEERTKRWALDEVVTNTGKPSEVYYMVRMGASLTRDDLLTAIRDAGGAAIAAADLEMGESLVEEELQRS